MKQKARVAMLLALVTPACSFLPGRDSDVSYMESEKQLTVLVDEAMSRGLKGNLPERGDVRQKDCQNADLAPTEEVYPVYEYHFPIELLVDDPEEFVRVVESVWKNHGLTIDQDNNTPGVTGSFATGDGFSLEVFVNRNSNMAKVGGSGPCASRN